MEFGVSACSRVRVVDVAKQAERKAEEGGGSRRRQQEARRGRKGKEGKGLELANACAYRGERGYLSVIFLIPRVLVSCECGCFSGGQGGGEDRGEGGSRAVAEVNTRLHEGHESG